MELEIVTIGTELVLGHTIDTNAAYLARALASIGARVARKTTVPDDPDLIRGAVSGGLTRTGFVITTGGLGPTRDDMLRVKEEIRAAVKEGRFSERDAGERWAGYLDHAREGGL